jgi:hypothetical protein
MSELCTIYDYMRAYANLLGERILQAYPALHPFDDPISPRIAELLRKPFPAQTIAIMGVAKRWLRARTGMVVAECGIGKTLGTVLQLSNLLAFLNAQYSTSQKRD